MRRQRTAASAGRRFGRRPTLLALVAALAVTALSPPAPAAAKDDLYGESPMCGDDCSQSGVSWSNYEKENYGIDNWIPLSEKRGPGGPLTVDVPKFENMIPSAIQSVSAVVWQGALLIVNGALLLLEWAFSLALTEDAMPQLERAVLDLHENVLGTPWFLAAIAVAGLWGIWNGLVRLRTIQTFTGLLATVLLMAAALFVINRPDDTVGEFSRLANDSALGVIGLGAEGSADGEESWKGAGTKIFNLVAHQPWCALQFGDVNFCQRDDPTRDGEEKVYQAWLKHPAWQKEKNDNGEEEREEVYNRFRDANDRVVHPDRVKLQEAGGAFERLGILALILLGLLGAVCLFLWLGLKLVLAGVMVLFLTLVTPVMLLAPAFGEAGRKAFGTWAKRLGGAIIAKLVYALFLAIVIFIANLIAGLESLSWGGQWMILIVLWWGVLIKRKDIVGFATGDQGGAMGGLGLLKAYLGYRAIRDVGGTVVRGATAPARAVRGTYRGARGAIRWGSNPAHATGKARDQAARDQIKDDLRGQAHQKAEQDRAWAKRVLSTDQKWRAHRSGNGKRPRGKNPPSQAKVAHARSIIARHGVKGDIAIKDADIERFVRESGNPALQERYETMQRPMTRGEIRHVEWQQDQRPDRGRQFQSRIRHERKRYRQEQRLEQRRKRVYR